MKNVIAIDLGGTKILAAVMNQSGKILTEIKTETQLQNGWPGLRKQLSEICFELMKSYSISAVGIGSAGPLNAFEGTLLNPTNFGWNSKKKVFITRDLNKILKKPIAFENDALAAALGEAWLGKACQNSISITLGTGLGVGVLINGKVLRGKDSLHPELGHLVLNPNDTSSHCECGARGCAEGFLSGVNFAKRFSKMHSQKTLNAEEINKLATNGDASAVSAFDEYALLLGQFISSLIVLSYPDEIVLSGSFANASLHFLEKTKNVVRENMQMRQKTFKIIPKIRVSKLKNKNGLYGAGFIALNHKSYLKKS